MPTGGKRKQLLSFTDTSADSLLQLLHTGPAMFEPRDATATDPLVLFVVQPQGVVSHAQHGDDEVDQSEDAVKPQEAVAEGHRDAAVSLHGINDGGKSHSFAARRSDSGLATRACQHA